jgi:hypothetical protein
VAEHVACIGDITNAQKILSEYLEIKDHLKDIGVERRIMLKWIMDFQVGKCLKITSHVRRSKHVNKPSLSEKNPFKRNN